MPRVNLGRDPDKERREATRKLIRSGMVNAGIQNQAELGKRLGLSQGAVSKKIKDNYWTLEELVKLAKILRFQAADLALMVGVKA